MLSQISYDHFKSGDTHSLQHKIYDLKRLIRPCDLAETDSSKSNCHVQFLLNLVKYESRGVCPNN